MKKFLSFFLKLAVSLLLVSYILSKANLQAIWQTFQSANYRLLLVALSLHIIGFTISAFRWRLLLRIQGIEASAGRLFLSYVVGQFFNFFLPTTVGGDLFRIYDTRVLSQGAARSASVILIERLTGLFALLSIACVAAVIGSKWVGQIPEILALVGIFLLAVIFLIFIFLNRRTVTFFNYLSARPIFPGKVKNIFIQIAEAANNFRRHPRAFISPLILAFLLQLNVAFHIYFIALAVKINLPLAYFFVLVPIIQVLLMIPISIGGLGLSENVFAFFLGKFGVPIHQAVALSLLSFSMKLLIGLAGAIIYNLKKS